MNKHSIAQFIKQHYPAYWGLHSYPVQECAVIHKVAEEWGIFCNFAPTPLIVDGVTFKSSEELFQFMKFKDAEIIRQIRKGITRKGKISQQVKMTSKSYEETYRREDWGSMLLDAMKFCLVTKYEQSPAFRDALEASKDKYIVEDQTTFAKKQADAWGVKLDGTNFVGPNLLGQFLMELRDTGTLAYHLPDDAFQFLEVLKECSE